VRADIPRGLQAAYIAHAAGESNRQNCRNMHVVVLTAKDEAELRELAHRLSAACLPHHPMRETDGAFAGQMLSFGVEPCRKEVARRWLSSQPLLK
jgi:hypothetical protein